MRPTAGFPKLRYGGKPASFLRGFRAVYLGIFFNVLIMAAVTLAIIKYGQLLFGFSKIQCVFFGSIGVVIYATLGGIKGCIWADFFQYSIAMFGAVWAAIHSVKEAGIAAARAGVVENAEGFGLAGLLSHPNVAGKLSIFPDFNDPNMWVPMLLMPLAVQWWAAWYPGAEPGGGGYIAQRMLSAKDEKNAVGATLLFNFAHYALRPWPWIIVALASLVVYPEVADIQRAEEEGKVTYTVGLTKEGAEALSPAARFGRMRGGQGEGGPEIEYSATLTLTMTPEGKMGPIEIAATMKGFFREREFSSTTRTTIEVTGLGESKVEVPEDVMTKFTL